MRLNDTVLVLVVVLIWGVSFTVIKVGLAELPPFLFSALRFAVVASLVFLVPYPRTVSVFNIVLIGLLLGVVKFGLLFTAMDAEIAAGPAALLLQSQVFFTLAFGALFFREYLTRQQIFGVGVALLGLFSFVVVSKGAASPLGILLVLLAALTWACVNVLMKQIEQKTQLSVIVWASLVPVAPLLFLSWCFETKTLLSSVSELSANGWLAVLYMGLLATLAFAAWGKLLSKYSAVSVTPYALLIPIFGIVSSRLFLGERSDLLESAAMAIILIGLAVCLLPSSNRPKSSKTCGH